MPAASLVSVYAKAPLPGAVKTRLIPAMGAENAAMLHMALTERALATACATRAAVELCCAPDCAHPFFDDCAEQFGIALTEQGEGDLGERMARTLARGLADHAAVLIVGADAPAVTRRHCDAAMAALQQHDVVLIPADDGGYVLIGARRVALGMFDGVEWGEATVLERQRAALTRCGLTWTELDALWDLDRPEDLARLATLVPPLAFQWSAA